MTKIYRQPRFQNLAWQIVAITGCRLLLNTARRFAYPFAPALSRGLGVPLTSITSSIALMQLTSFLGVAGGPLADWMGYRKIMLAGMLMLSIGMLIVGVFPAYGVVAAGLLLAGISKNIFDPAVYGYTGQRVPFSKRGRVAGIMETAWAASALAGIPVIGMLMDNHGWKAPFWCLGISGLIGFFILFRLIPADGSGFAPKKQNTWKPAWSQLVRERSALGLLGFGFWMSLGNDQLFVVYGAWFEKEFQTGIAAIGFGTAAIGAAELAGEALTAILGDKIGLKRSILIGVCLTACSYGLLALLQSSFTLALGGLCLIFLTFEFSIVCAISLSTEVIPAYRATMVAAFFGIAGLGRLTGALLGGPLWLLGGIGAVSISCAGACALAGLSLLWGCNKTVPHLMQSKK
ncbi:MAG: MFS transporter [Desulfobacteraceae bacterium]|nr:MFS transporter [Desulfobacteraceae bacterium]